MASGARAQKPVGSAAWISTEKENVSQLVEQELEEVEYPVSHEMDWLNEHMAEIFDNNQFNFTEAFKTPGKLRGKTPRTARKRNFEESRVPLSEIFSSIHNQKENKSIASPTGKRSPAKPAAPIPTKNVKPTTENAPQPHYPDLSQNLNSFPQYNTDSGYHGMTDDHGGDDDDDVILTQTQPESQPSTQPLTQPLEEKEPTPEPLQTHDTADRRTTESSFHSAQEDNRQRSETVEPANDVRNTMHTVEVHPPKLQLKDKKPNEKPVSKKPESEQEHDFECVPEKVAKEPTRKPEQKPEPPKPTQERELQLEQKIESESEEELEPEQQPEPEPQPEPVQNTKSSSPMQTPATQPPQSVHEDDDIGMEKEDMALDDLDDDDDIGSPSDGSTPERPPIRKSSLTFASLPAREPLTKKSLGGTRVSRTSHIGTGFLGRQTGGHRTTQTALENTSQAQGDKMEVDDDAEPTRDGPDAETRSSKQHNKSSTQRLHEKISMLGKLQPSRPTKSIPSVSGLSSAQVNYPDLLKTETKPEVSDRKSRETPAPEPMTTDEDEWIKPSMNTPQRPNMAKSRTMDIMDRTNQAPEKDDTVHNPDVGGNQMAKPNENHSTEMSRPKSTTPLYTPPQQPSHQKSASASNLNAGVSTTPAGSPKPQDVPVSASKWKLQSIMKSAKGLFSTAGGVSAAARAEVSSPTEERKQPEERIKPQSLNRQESQSAQESTAPRPEGRRTRSSTEREEKRRQQEIEEREREEQEEKEEKEEKAREQEKQKATQLKAAREKVSLEREERAASVAPSPKKIPQPQKYASKEPELAYETASKAPAPSSIPQQKQNERRPVKPTRETLQKPKPQPVSIRVGSALSRQIPMASGSNVQESAAAAPTPASASKPSTIKKKASNNSLHTASSNNSLKNSVSSNSQRKVQLASERKREQEEREARRKEEQRRELERKRAAQQQEESRRQELRGRAEAERRERQASVDPKKAAHMQAIEKRRLENQRRLERQGSQQPGDTSVLHQPERPASQASRPASRLGSIQPFGRSINTPQPNPAKPPKRAMDDEASHRPAPPKPSVIPQPGDSKRRRTEEEHNPPPSVRPAMAPPIRQSNIRKEPTKPSLFNGQRTSTAPQSGSSILKTAQPQRPAHPLDMSKYASGKIPFAESSNAAQPKPGPSSAQKAATKQSPKYPSGESIALPEIATDSEDEDSDAEMLPVPKWAQPRELENLLRQQEGMEVDSIFGPVAPFSLEDTFKADKKIKKFRERTSSANWSGADRLTQDEIRKDLAERQRLRLNGGWTFDTD